MVGAVEIRPLTREDDRSRFSCGEPALDRFFQHYAGQNQFKLRLAVTYVAVLDGEIAGFATVSAGSVERLQMPGEGARRRLPAYPLPVVRLARMGVAKSVQRRGLGGDLLQHVLRLALAQRDTVGCLGVLADAKPGAVAFYERLGFQALEGAREGRVHGGPVAVFLGIDVIAAAAASPGRRPRF